MLNAAPRCASLKSISAGRRQSEQVGARLQIATDAVGRAEAHSADGYRPVHLALNPPQDVYLTPALPNVTCGVPGITWHASARLELSVVGQNLLHSRHVEYGFPDATRPEIERSVYGKFAWRY